MERWEDNETAEAENEEEQFDLPLALIQSELDQLTAEANNVKREIKELEQLTRRRP